MNSPRGLYDYAEGREAALLIAQAGTVPADRADIGPVETAP